MSSHITSPDNAPKLLDWFANRGGVAVWRNCNMSSQSLGQEVFTPATQADGSAIKPPGWQYESKPKAIVQDPAVFTVQTWREVCRIKVIPSRYGPPADPIARGRKKLDAAMAKAGKDAEWRWDPDGYTWGSPWHQVIVEVPDTTIPLPEWAMANTATT